MYLLFCSSEIQGLKALKALGWKDGLFDLLTPLVSMVFDIDGLLDGLLDGLFDGLLTKLITEIQEHRSIATSREAREGKQT